jgi:hypothetical protein
VIKLSKYYPRARIGFAYGSSFILSTNEESEVDVRMCFANCVHCIASNVSGDSGTKHNNQFRRLYVRQYSYTKILVAITKNRYVLTGDWSYTREKIVFMLTSNASIVIFFMVV